MQEKNPSFFIKNLFFILKIYKLIKKTNFFNSKNLYLYKILHH